MVDRWKKYLVDAMLARGLTMTELSKRLGKNPHYVTQLINRDHAPSVGTLQNIADELKIDVATLLTAGDIDADAEEFAYLFNSLNRAQRDAVKVMMRTMAKPAQDAKD